MYGLLWFTTIKRSQNQISGRILSSKLQEFNKMEFNKIYTRYGPQKCYGKIIIQT